MLGHIDEALLELDDIDMQITGYRMQLNVCRFLILDRLSLPLPGSAIGRYKIEEYGKLILRNGRPFRMISRISKDRIEVYKSRRPISKHC